VATLLAYFDWESNVVSVVLSTESSRLLKANVPKIRPSSKIYWNGSCSRTFWYRPI